MIRWLARRGWGQLLLAPIVVAAGGWSWLTYVFGKLPLDKQQYWRDAWGWRSPQMDWPWNELAVNASVFHELKNIGSEWARAWPQTAFKVLSMFILLLVGVVIGLALALTIAVL